MAMTVRQNPEVAMDYVDDPLLDRLAFALEYGRFHVKIGVTKFLRRVLEALPVAELDRLQDGFLPILCGFLADVEQSHDRVKILRCLVEFLRNPEANREGRFGQCLAESGALEAVSDLPSEEECALVEAILQTIQWPCRGSQAGAH
jgi:hypothetical protein